MWVGFLHKCISNAIYLKIISQNDVLEDVTVDTNLILIIKLM